MRELSGALCLLERVDTTSAKVSLQMLVMRQQINGSCAGQPSGDL